MSSVLALKNELARYIAQKYNEGILERQFEDLRILQDDDEPTFVADVLTLFCNDNDRLIKQLGHLGRPMDFPRVQAYVHQLRGSSGSVGAKQVKLACTEFRDAVDRNDEAGCIKALYQVSREFYRAKATFETIVEMERRINALTGPSS